MLYGNKAEILKGIGERMRKRRLLLNLSQQLAAERSGLSVVTLQNLEKGKGSSLWALVSLCRTYGHTNWILELAPEENIEYSIAANTGKERIRAAKRKGTRDV